MAPWLSDGRLCHDKIGCKTAALAYTDFPPGKDSTEAFKTGFEKAGGKIADSIPMGSPVQVPDFTPFFQKIKDGKPDCMYVFIPSGAHATGVMKAYGELGMRKAGVKLIGPMDLIPDNKLQDMGDAAIGTIVMGNYAVDLDNAENKAFNAAWHKAYGKDSYPDFMSAAGWDTMHAIFDTIKKLNGKVGRLQGGRRDEGLDRPMVRAARSRSMRPRATSCRTSTRWKSSQAGRQAWRQGSRHHQGGEGRVQGAQDRALRFLIA